MLDLKTHSKCLEKIIDIAHDWLLNKTEASNELQYLSSRISENDIIKHKFGYISPYKSSIEEFISSFHKDIEKSKDILHEIGIFYSNGDDYKSFFTNHKLIIPFYNVYGKPVSLVGRTILSEEIQKTNKICKYKHIPFNKRKHLYGLSLTYKDVLRKDYIVTVEGQFDFISGLSAGITNITALGGSKFTFEQIALIKRFTNNFYVLLDTDEAGDAGWDKINKAAPRYDIVATRLGLPSGYKDLHEYLKENTIDDIKDLVIT